MAEEFLGKASDELAHLGGLSTAREICQQPVLWQQVYQHLSEQRDDLQAFISSRPFTKVILTGAGTSGLAGQLLQGVWVRHMHANTHAIPTTHLVSHPQNYITPTDNLLMVSFARSGNSPESMASVRLASQLAHSCKHLIITCNPEGKLTGFQSPDHQVVLMPPAAHDAGLAMTSSYTCLTLAGLLMARLPNLPALGTQVDLLSQLALRVVSESFGFFEKLAAYPFRRVVFLGSGPLYGTAAESHLKVQELTDGYVVGKYDSFLGFRHGPKSVVDKHTLVVYLLTNQAYSCRYEMDLVNTMRADGVGMAQVVVEEKPLHGPNTGLSFAFSTGNTETLEEEFLAILSVLPAQLLGYFKSLDLGLQPDNPSVSGAIHRVVRGVNIYTYFR